MYRPPQRLRHQPAFGRVPGAEEAQASRLFSAVRVGPLTLAERTWVPAMVPWRATADGFVNEAVLVPTYRVEQDDTALAQLKKAFPGREVIGLDCRPLIRQHGSLHCVTMQYPEGVVKIEG